MSASATFAAPELDVHAPPASRILVAMSGGVDSALAAVLLREAGHEIVGVNMRTYKPTDADHAAGRKFQTCCSPEDAADARSVADRGDFPFYVLDLEREFHAAVVQPFIENYLAGLTPNPCVLCNNHLKLGVLLQKAHLWGCDFVATGHYARVAHNEETGRYELRRAADRAKDQTYYLFGLRQDQLRRFLCPLGSLEKPEVRRLARERGLVSVADKPESMEICFVPGNDYREFLRSRVDENIIQPGDIVTRDGEVLGRHTGLAHYTVGQRRGLGIASGDPLYVIDLLLDKNLLVVGADSETYSASLVFDRANFVAIEPPSHEIEAMAQIRHRHAPAACTVTPLTGGRYCVRFTEPQRSVAPGQAVVLYRKDSVLGGGWIVEKSAG